MKKYQFVILSVVATLLYSYNAEKVSKILRASCTVHDPKMISNVTCWAKPKSRTLSLVNMRANLTQSLTKVNFNVQLYRRSNLQFKHFLVNSTEDLCSFMANRKSGGYIKLLANIYLPYSNVNHTCPYFGYIYIKDLPLDWKNVPNLWPPGEYHLDIMLIGNSRKIVTVQFFFEIKEKIQRW